jgi:hypothetical protein
MQAGPNSSQEHLFKVVGRSMVENCLDGYNSAIFAYGQTGSGKTYTMMGSIPEADADFLPEAGLIPRLFDHLFARIRELEAQKVPCNSIVAVWLPAHPSNCWHGWLTSIHVCCRTLGERSNSLRASPCWRYTRR